MTKSLTWNQYDTALKQRGSINFWISDEIEELWYDKSKSKVYSDYAVKRSLKLTHLGLKHAI